MSEGNEGNETHIATPISTTYLHATYKSWLQRCLRGGGGGATRLRRY